VIQFREEFPPDFKPDSILLPQAQTPPARAGTGIFVGQVLPARARPENPKNAFEHAAIVGPRPAFADVLGEERFDVRPLFVGQKYISHPQLFTGKKAKSANKIKKSFAGDL
jgi:hypothetical protein